MNTSPTQSDRVLSVLKTHSGQWVPMVSLGEAAGAWAVHSRISELRVKRGLMIDHKNERVEGKVHSFYRLIS